MKTKDLALNGIGFDKEYKQGDDNTNFNSDGTDVWSGWVEIPLTRDGTIELKIFHNGEGLSTPYSITVNIKVTVTEEREPSEFEDVLTNIDKYIPNSTTIEGSEEFASRVSVIMSVITNIGIILAVIIIAVIGVKYMLGSVEEKADYKRALVPYLIGACLLFGISTFVKILQNVMPEVSTCAHEWNSGSVSQLPTCTTKGKTEYTCLVCGDTQEKSNIEIDPKNHLWGKQEVTKIATCTEKGERTYTCSYNVIHTKTEEISTVPHEFTKYESNNDATCTEDGTKTANCDYNCGKTNTIIDVGSSFGGHDYIFTGTATCTEKGTIEYKCSRCDYKYTEDDKELGHDYKETKKVEAKCEADGNIEYTCSRCDDTYTETLPAEGHSWIYTGINWGFFGGPTEPTCNQEGKYSEAKCSVCGEEVRDLILPKDPNNHEKSGETYIDIIDNGNGTHDITTRYACCNKVKTSNTEECVYDSRGVCKVCGHNTRYGNTYYIDNGDGTHSVKVSCDKCNVEISSYDEPCSYPLLGGNACSVCGHHKKTVETITDNGNGTHTIVVYYECCNTNVSTVTNDCSYNLNKCSICGHNPNRSTWKWIDNQDGTCSEYKVLMCCEAVLETRNTQRHNYNLITRQCWNCRCDGKRINFT